MSQQCRALVKVWVMRGIVACTMTRRCRRAAGPSGYCYQHEQARVGEVGE